MSFSGSVLRSSHINLLPINACVQILVVLELGMSASPLITLFRSICGTDITNIIFLDISYIQTVCEIYQGIFYETLSVPRNIVMDLNHVTVTIHISYQYFVCCFPIVR